jgi:hypothetical protein
MADSGKSGFNDCDVWLWDGSTEFEGLLLKLQDSSFSARLRQARKGGGTGTALGKRVAATYLDVQQQFLKKKFLAHFKGTAEGTLFEASIDGVQVSSDGDFDYVVSGRFGTLDEKQLEILRRMSVEQAAVFLARRVG